MWFDHVPPSPRRPVPPERRDALVATLHAQVTRYRRVIDDLVPACPDALSSGEVARRAAARAAPAEARRAAAMLEAERTGAAVAVPPDPSVFDRLRAEDPELHRRVRALYLQLDATAEYVARGVAGTVLTRGERASAARAALEGRLARADARKLGLGVVKAAARAVGSHGLLAVAEAVVGAAAVSVPAGAAVGADEAAAALAAGRDAGAGALGQAATSFAGGLPLRGALTPVQTAARALAAVAGPSLAHELAAPGGRLARAWDAGFRLAPAVRGLFAERATELEERLDAWARGKATLSGAAATRATPARAPLPASLLDEVARFAAAEPLTPQLVAVRLAHPVYAAGRWGEFRALVGDLLHDPAVEHILVSACYEFGPGTDPAEVTFLTEHVSPHVRQLACERLGIAHQTVDGVAPARVPPAGDRST